MDGSDPNVVAVSAPPKARREGSIYEKYLNIKNNVLADDAEHGAAKTCTEISNSTDEQELEAGEVVRRVPRSAVQVSLELVDCSTSVVADTGEDEARATASEVE
ncbi:unnamed protein product [Hyaloperonospora brassicae]|uniref:RxLR effector candidate protein n=1 Tax=Hyaloperonospora brassicae TaxID=162125 RepID=A0AAV0UI00_HYABA|nr:unnamed protein product [Hyaloperonospora brassicae]